MAKGTVKWFNAEKGFGFIRSDDLNIDVFIHISALKSAGLESLREGQRVSFVIVDGKSGKKQASQINALAEPDRIRQREESYIWSKHDDDGDKYERRLSNASTKSEIERIQDAYSAEMRKWR